MLGDTEAVVDRRVGRRGVATCGTAHEVGRYAGVHLGDLGAVLDARHELRPALERRGVTALIDERAVDEALGHDDVRERVDDGHVGAGAQLQELARADVRPFDEVDAARIYHDERRARAQTALEARGEHGVRVGGVGADDEHDIRVRDRLEVLSAGGGAERSLEPVAGR